MNKSICNFIMLCMEYISSGAKDFSTREAKLKDNKTITRPWCDDLLHKYICLWGVRGKG